MIHSITDIPTLVDLGKDGGLISQPPTNYETPLPLLDSFITPVEQFFVRANGPISVDIDPETWCLSVTGHVDHDLTLSLADLTTLPPTTYTAFLECSGNSRSSFPPDAPVEGTNWGHGAIGNAAWSGTLLKHVLERAGIKPGAVDVIAQGGDFDTMQRGLPIDIAMSGDVLLAWKMNDRSLLPVHGGPVRLIVPGWGAIASTKWLTALTVVDHQFDGFWNADNYVLWNDDGTARARVTTMPVKSLITSHTANAPLASGKTLITGFAWSGNGGVQRVDISTDDGATWSAARITDQAGPFAWVRFEYDWSAPTGPAVLMARATDNQGNVQPVSAIWNRKGYQMNAIIPVPVTVT